MSGNTTTMRQAASATSQLPGAVPVGLSRCQIELKAFFREKDAVIFIFAFPVILLLIFGTVFRDDVAAGVSFAQYFLPGMIAAGLMLVSFQSLAIQIAIERDDGTLKRLEGTPMPRAAYFVGKIGLVLVTGLLQVALLLVVARVVFGVPIPTEPLRWVTFAWISLLGIAAGTLLGIAFSSVPRSGKSASAVVTPVVLVLQFISGVFFLYSDIPAWLRTIAEVFPLKWMAQGMRSVFLPDSMAAIEVSGSWQHGMTALVLGAWTIVGLVLCLRTFRWRRRDDA
jgi:ABC-2 type transport system permease protein